MATDWVEPVAAVSTALAALTALGFGTVAEIRAARALRTARIQHERAQAVRVAAWQESRAEASSPRSMAVVQNASDEPVWAVRVRLETTYPDEEDVKEMGVVAPGARLEFETRYTPPDDYAGIDVEFTDNGGRRWQRTWQGVLQRADGDGVG